MRWRRAQRLFAAGAMLAIGTPIAIPAHAQAKVATRPATARIAFTGRVTDTAAILAPSQHQALDQDLTRIEARTRAQIIVVTVPTLGGQDIARYARNLGDRRGVGDAPRDDGVVVLLAPGDSLVRIAVGEELERVLTDEICQRIINQVMLPEFREGRLYEGLLRGVAALNAEL